MKQLYTFLFIAFIIVTGACEKADNRLGSSTGKGGSLARFTIANGHLYVVDGNELHTFSLQNAAKPQQLNSVTLSFNNEVETIYPFKDKLFIGSSDAMYIFSIADPAQPQFEGSASHVRACDPVVANDKYAYVTVRTGNNCNGNINALYVYDVSNGAQQSTRVFDKDLSNPHGLGIYNDHLYVCDGAAGLLVFDIHKGAEPVQLATKSGYIFYDCIPVSDVLICMVENGMVLYDISNPAQPTMLSEIIN